MFEPLENMLIYYHTNIMNSPAQTVVNTVNCVGVMGKGIAAEFKQRYPDMFEAYKEICDRKLLEPGKLWLWKGSTQWVLNFPTKVHWRNPSRLEWIEAGLKKFVSEFQARGIREISFPRLGCGNGNLDWSDVRPLMERYLSRLPISVYIHDYEKDIGIPEHLEELAAGVSFSKTFDGSFANFKSHLEGLVQATGGSFVDLETGQPFSARIGDEGLTIGAGQRDSSLADEDLRGTWIALLSGVLTQDKLGWAVGEDASRLFSIVGLLPYTRPVQIQRAVDSDPQLAVQLTKPSGAMTASLSAS